MRTVRVHIYSSGDEVTTGGGLIIEYFLFAGADVATAGGIAAIEDGIAVGAAAIEDGIAVSANMHCTVVLWHCREHEVRNSIPK